MGSRVPVILDHVGTATYAGGPASVSSAIATLTGDILPTDPDESRGIAIAMISSEPQATAPGDFSELEKQQRANFYISDTTPALVDYEAPYFNQPAYESLGYGTVVPHSQLTVSSTKHMFRCMKLWRFYQGLSAGDEIQISLGSPFDFPVLPPVDWWRAHIYTIEGAYPYNYFGSQVTSSGWGGAILGAVGTPTSNQVKIGNDTIGPWKDFVTTSVTTADLSQTFTRVLPGQFSDSLDYEITRPGVFKGVFNGFHLPLNDEITETFTLTRSNSSAADWNVGMYPGTFGGVNFTLGVPYPAYTPELIHLARLV